MPRPSANDATLVTQCRSGHWEAFEPLVRRYQNAALAIAWTYLQNQQDAQDLVQDAFIDAYCKLDQLHNPDRFGGWFRTIVANRCKVWLRRHQLGFHHPASLEQADPLLSHVALAHYHAQTQQRELWQAVHQLPEHYRVVLLLHYLSGFSEKEIATFLEVPLSTVKGRLQQARRRLRAAILPDALDVIERDKEAIAMSQIDISQDVQAIICRLASQPLQQTIPLDETRHVVLYCGIAAEVEIRQHHGHEVRIEGTKTSIGLSQETAQQSVEAIELLMDRVEDYTVHGPHPGEVFLGTNQRNDGSLSASRGTTTGLWVGRYIQNGRGWMFNDIPLENLYPELHQQARTLPDEIRTTLAGPVTRVTLCRRTLEDLVLPRTALSEEVQKVFQVNYQDNERVHGGVGYARLTLSVPVGVMVTIVRCSQVQATGLETSLNLIGCHASTLTKIKGQVRLFDSSFGTVSKINGKLWQRFYMYGGQEMGEKYRLKRSGTFECHMSDIEGDIDIDIGRVQLEAENLVGQVRIYNHYGVTCLTQKTWTPGSRYWLRTVAGECHLKLPDALTKQVTVTAHTLAGVIDYAGVAEITPVAHGNDPHTIFFSTKPGVTGHFQQWSEVLDVDFQLQTESGLVAVEKVT